MRGAHGSREVNPASHIGYIAVQSEACGLGLLGSLKASKVRHKRNSELKGAKSRSKYMFTTAFSPPFLYNTTPFRSLLCLICVCLKLDRNDLWRPSARRGGAALEGSPWTALLSCRAYLCKERRGFMFLRMISRILV